MNLSWVKKTLLFTLAMGFVIGCGNNLDNDQGLITGSQEDHHAVKNSRTTASVDAEDVGEFHSLYVARFDTIAAGYITDFFNNYNGPIPVDPDTLWKYCVFPAAEDLYDEAYFAEHSSLNNQPDISDLIDAASSKLDKDEALQDGVDSLYVAGRMSAKEYEYCTKLVTIMNTSPTYDKYQISLDSLTNAMDTSKMSTVTSVCIGLFEIAHSSCWAMNNGVGSLSQAAIEAGQGTVPLDWNWPRIGTADGVGYLFWGPTGAAVTSGIEMITEVIRGEW